MTNREKWLEYTSGLSSPQNYLEWGWLYTMAASLQRRVWIGPPNQPCFPNMYVFLVGQPGIGKGLTIKEVSSLLRHWTLDSFAGAAETPKNPDDKQQSESTVEADMKHAQEVEYQGKSKGAELLKPKLIPVCADAITYEALVNAVADSYRRINYYEYSDKEQKQKLKIYGHSSLCFVLQELASLMRKRTNDTINFLLGLYDCPLDYEYTTLTRGKDRVRRGCLNILGGTTPSFMQSTFDEKLMDEGFTSRSFYIFAQKNRKNCFFIPPLSSEQEQYKNDLLEHIKNLTTLYGNVHVDKETWDFMTSWWNDQENNKHLRKNRSVKLIPYYSRKNIHVMKVAMAMHFGESTEMHIPLETFKKAIDFLEIEELNMHLAITLEGNNPISKVTRKLLELLQNGDKNFVELLVETHHIIDKKGLEEAIDFLQETKQIVPRQEHDDTTDEEVIYWSIKK